MCALGDSDVNISWAGVEIASGNCIRSSWQAEQMNAKTGKKKITALLISQIDDNLMQISLIIYCLILPNDRF